VETFSGEKKRKRTSIAAPEKRSLEAYFTVQPRPSGEKIAAIAEKLDLKKNVVRVWFCNQRQKQVCPCQDAAVSPCPFSYAG
jgi:class 4 POU domain transcription factor